MVVCFVDIVVESGDFSLFRKSIDLLNKKSPSYCEKIINGCNNGVNNLKTANGLAKTWLSIGLKESLSKEGRAVFHKNERLNADDLVWLRQTFNDSKRYGSSVGLSITILSGLIASLNGGTKEDAVEVNNWVELILSPELNRIFKEDVYFFKESESKYKNTQIKIKNIGCAIGQCSTEQRSACFCLLEMLCVSSPDLWKIKNFPVVILGSFDTPEDKLKWLNMYESHVLNSGDKKLIRALEYTKKQLESGKPEDKAWWEREKLNKAMNGQCVESLVKTKKAL